MGDEKRRAWRALPWAALGLWWASMVATAQDAGEQPGAAKPAEPPSAAQQLVAVETGDPLELARIVDRLGDGPILKALEGSGRVDVRLQAIRAARWLTEPERALGPLIGLMAGRDGLLAPAAARSVRAIARALAEQELATREAIVDGLPQHVSALEMVAATDWVRADVRAMAVAAAASLAQVVGSGAEGSDDSAVPPAKGD